MHMRADVSVFCVRCVRIRTTYTRILQCVYGLYTICIYGKRM